MSLSTPQQVLERLDAIERDLAIRQNLIEAAARAWYIAKRDKEHAWAVAFIRADGAMPLRKALADEETATIGQLEEAEYEALKAVMRTLDTRASVGQSILRAQGRP